MSEKINLPPLRDFEFFIVEYNKTEIIRIKEYYCYMAIGYTKNFSLIIKDIFGKKYWIKEKFWNSSESPLWKNKNGSGVMIRFKIEEMTPSKLLATVFAFNSKSDITCN